MDFCFEEIRYLVNNKMGKFKIKIAGNNRVMEVRCKILTPLEATRRNLFSLERFEISRFTI